MTMAGFNKQPVCLAIQTLQTALAIISLHIPIALLLQLFKFLIISSISPSEAVRMFDILSVFESQNYNSFYNVQGDYPDPPGIGEILY